MKNLDYREALTEWRIGLQLNNRDQALEYAEKMLPQIIERAVNMERVLDAIKNYLRWYFRTHDSKTTSIFEMEQIVDICRALENAGMADVCIKREAIEDDGWKRLGTEVVFQMSIEDWKARANKYTSGDQVWDILRDWGIDLRQFTQVADMQQARIAKISEENARMQKVVDAAQSLFKFLENAGIYRDLTLPDLAVRPYNDLMTRLEEALAELEAVE